MLTWNANFQIPNSGAQALNVYAFAEYPVDGMSVVKFYADEEKEIFLFDRLFDVDSNRVYESLAELEYFEKYSLSEGFEDPSQPEEDAQELVLEEATEEVPAAVAEIEQANTLE